MSTAPNTKYKTMMCKHFQKSGTCPMEQRCHFAHSQNELRKLNDPLPETTPQLKPSFKPQNPGQQSLGKPNTANYKTIKCTYFEKGYCKYADNCNYAHGDKDVRAGNMPPTHMPPFGSPTKNIPRPQVADPGLQKQGGHLGSIIGQLRATYANDNETLERISKIESDMNKGVLDPNSANSALSELMSRANPTQPSTDPYSYMNQGSPMNYGMMYPSYYPQAYDPYQQAMYMMGYNPYVGMPAPYGGGMGSHAGKPRGKKPFTRGGFRRKFDYRNNSHNHQPDSSKNGFMNSGEDQNEMWEGGEEMENHQSYGSAPEDGNPQNYSN